MDAPHAAYRLLSVYNPALQLDCKETFANESLRFYDPGVDLTTITPDVTALRALGHPVRLRILGLLRADGPATATALAQRLGLNSGATSYHLRQLAAHGFVVDDPERGTGRDRWWKAAHRSTLTDPSVTETPEGREVVDAYAQAIAVVHTEMVQRAMEEAPTLPEAWRRPSSMSDWHLRLTPERADELMSALYTVIGSWDEADEDAEGTAEFVVQLHAFPRPGTLPPAAPDIVDTPADPA